jgi:hypothetical protein
VDGRIESRKKRKKQANKEKTRRCKENARHKEKRQDRRMPGCEEKTGIHNKESMKGNREKNEKEGKK